MIENSDVFIKDVPVGDIVFFKNKKQFVYKPEQDITPYECAKLMQLITFAMACHSAFDWESFVIENNLSRHVKAKYD
jgi:hypothetical protein